MTSQIEAEILESQRKANRRDASLSTVPKTASGSAPAPLPPSETADAAIGAAEGAVNGQVPAPPIPLPGRGYRAVTIPPVGSGAPEPKLNGNLQQNGSSQQNSAALSAAVSYIRTGWQVFPGKRQAKTPRLGWPWTKAKLTEADATEYFGRDQHNVLVALR